MKKGKILVTGTIAFDHLFTYDSSFLEQLKEAASMEVLSISFQPHRYVKRYGGTGSNIAWNIALLGNNPLLVAKIGADGHEYVELLRKRGIDTSGVDELESSMTSTGVCCTDTKQHQIWFFYHGADAVGHWPNLDSHVQNILYAIIGPRNPEKMLEGMLWCHTKEIPALFDPGQYILDFSKEELQQAASHSKGIILNEFEWKMFSEKIGWSEEETASKVEYLIITKGEQGHCIYMKNKELSFNRCNCENVVNPTGAGDAFRAGLVTGITSGWTLEEASKLGAAIASFVVEEEGTHLDSLDIKRLNQRMRDSYGEDFKPFA